MGKVFDFINNLKEGEILGVLDKNYSLIHTFLKKNNKTYLHVTIFNIIDLDDMNDMSYFIDPSIINGDDSDLNCVLLNVEQWFDLIKSKIQHDVDKELKSSENNNAKVIYNEILQDGGNVVSFNGDECGLLVAAVATDEDYYWVYINSDLKICLSSCVGSYDILEYNDCSFDTVMEYVNKYPDRLIQKIKDKIAQNIDFIFTPIILTKNN